MIHNSYVDESGNTGVNLADLDQPYYVLASVTIPQDQTEPGNTINSVFQSVKQNGQTEFKTSRWIKSAKYTKALSTIWDSIIVNAEDINVVILEKRYMAAALIVDNFFDGAYNDNECYDWVKYKNLRVMTAEYYYSRLSDQEIKYAGEVLTHATLESVKKLYTIILSHTDNPIYREMLIGVRNHLQELVNDLNNVLHDRQDLNESVFKSPNVTCFSSLGQMLVSQCVTKGYKTKIIFDSEDNLNRLYEYVFMRFQGIKDISIPRILELKSWKDRITDFISADSKNEVGLRAADVVASSAENTLKCIMDNQLPNAYNTKVKAFLKDAFYHGHLWSVMSEQCNKKMITSFEQC